MCAKLWRHVWIHSFHQIFRSDSKRISIAKVTNRLSFNLTVITQSFFSLYLTWYHLLSKSEILKYILLQSISQVLSSAAGLLWPLWFISFFPPRTKALLCSFYIHFSKLVVVKVCSPNQQQQQHDLVICQTCKPLQPHSMPTKPETQEGGALQYVS